MDIITKPSIVTNTHIEYLDKVQKSGVTNMFGAGQYLQNRFGINRIEAEDILLYWMHRRARTSPQST